LSNYCSQRFFIVKYIKIEKQMQDLIIIGAGPAGLTAGIYAARSRLDFIILEALLPGGLLTRNGLIENYPGFPEGISGSELAKKMTEQVYKAGIEITTGRVTAIGKEGEGNFLVTTSQPYHARAVIVASGSQPKKLGVPGETELLGKGVSYCALCDGPFFQRKRVAVVGNGNIAAQEALFLTKFAQKIFLLHQTESLLASAEVKKNLFATQKVAEIGNTIVREVFGKETVSGLRLQNVKTGEEFSLKVDGIFIFTGYKPSTDFLPSEVKLTSEGYVITGEDLQTSVEGIFAAGDCRQKSLRQVVTACSDGATALFSVRKYLEKI